MFQHEEFLKKALEECSMTQLVHDLGGVYLCCCVKQNVSQAYLAKALRICKILDEAAEKISEVADVDCLGLARVEHPMDVQ